MRRKFKWDKEESKRRGYLDRGSFYTTTGKEFLGPKDWPKRREEVLERDNYRCQMCRRDLSIYLDIAEIDHKIKRSQGGDDSLSNLQVLCDYPCHRGPKGKHG